MRTSKRQGLMGCIALCIALTACGGGGGGDSTPAPDGADTQTPPQDGNGGTPNQPPADSAPVFSAQNAEQYHRDLSNIAFRPASAVLLAADYIQFANVAVQGNAELANATSIDYLCTNASQAGIQVFLSERKVSFNQCLLADGRHTGDILVTPSSEAGVNDFTLQDYSLESSDGTTRISGQFQVTIFGDPATQTVLRRAESSLVRYEADNVTELQQYRYQQTQNLSDSKRYSEVTYQGTRGGVSFNLLTQMNFVGNVPLEVGQTLEAPGTGKWEITANDNSRLELNADSGNSGNALLTVQDNGGATNSNSLDWSSLMGVYAYGL